MEPNRTTLADRARWFAEHRSDLKAQALVAFARGAGADDPTRVESLERMHMDDVCRLADRMDAFEGGMR